MSDNRTKFKETEIGLIPAEWDVFEFGKAVDINPKRPIKNGDNVKFIAMTDIEPFNKKIASFSKRNFVGGSKFKNRDTLMARITPCLENGKTAFVDLLEKDEIAGGSTEFIVISGKKDVSDSNFAYYLTISPIIRTAAIQAMTGTSGRQRVETDKLEKQLVGLPPMDEQKRIAEILGALDEMIELNRRMNESLEKIASAIFKHWFVDDGDKLPDGWRMGELSDLIRVESGFPFSGGSFDDDGKYKLVTIKNVQNGHFVKECANALNFIPPKMPDYCNLKSGDILLSLTGNVGRVCLVSGENYLLNQRVAKLMPIDKKNRAFAYFLFRQNDMQNNLINMAKGTAQQNLSPIEMRSLEIVIPTNDILDKFAKIANPIFELIVKNIDNMENLSQIRDSLLPRLMSGKIRINL